MNKLFLGFSKKIEIPSGGFLLIDDEIPEIPKARIFDLDKHSLNPLKNIDYQKARALTNALYTIAPEGTTTLTVRNGKRAMLKALLSSRRLDKIDADEEVEGLVNDLLVSPLLKRIFCNPTNFSFNPNSVILVRLNRAEIGDFDALVIGLLLMNHYQGQVVVKDFGFYGRDGHVSLVRENRLYAGLNHLGEVTPRLRHALLGIKDKSGKGALYADAQVLAEYAGLAPHTNGFIGFVDEAMQAS